MATHVRNPVEWISDAFRSAGSTVAETGVRASGADTAHEGAAPVVRKITTGDLRAALASGYDDFMACRTDVILLVVIYPLIGLLLARTAFGADMLPLLFPLASGFALLGPIAAVGLYEMSRRRERGDEVSWADAFGVLGSPRFGPIILMGLLLLVIFLIWLAAAQAIYALTLGPAPPASVGAFVESVFGSAAGWTMIVLGMGVGFLFAVLVLTVSVVSFPLLLDHHVSLPTAIVTSVRAVAANPGAMAAWGAIVAIGLALGSLPLFLGLAIVLPILGHATWHLYRRVIAPTS